MKTWETKCEYLGNKARKCWKQSIKIGKQVWHFRKRSVKKKKSDNCFCHPGTYSLNSGYPYQPWRGLGRNSCTVWSPLPECSWTFVDQTFSRTNGCRTKCSNIIFRFQLYQVFSCFLVFWKRMFVACCWLDLMCWLGPMFACDWACLMMVGL